MFLKWNLIQFDELEEGEGLVCSRCVCVGVLLLLLLCVHPVQS